jgi:hypothetical protein
MAPCPHTVRYSSLTANLSPRLSEVDIAETITGPFSLYTQPTLLSANVRTILSALTFLNKLDSMESY